MQLYLEQHFNIIICFYELFNIAISTGLRNNELRRFWKKVAVAYTVICLKGLSKSTKTRSLDSRSSNKQLWNTNWWPYILTGLFRYYYDCYYSNVSSIFAVLDIIIMCYRRQIPLRLYKHRTWISLNSGYAIKLQLFAQ